MSDWLLGAAGVASIWCMALDWRGFPDPVEAGIACALGAALLVALFRRALLEAAA